MGSFIRGPALFAPTITSTNPVMAINLPPKFIGPPLTCDQINKPLATLK